VERPAGRLRRRPRLQSAQPHVLRPLMNSLDHRPNKPIVHACHSTRNGCT
jgi:hypothetical protein